MKSGRTWSHGHFYLLAKASHLGKVMHSVTATVHWDFFKKGMGIQKELPLPHAYIFKYVALH